MEIEQRGDRTIIIHGGKVIKETFPNEDAAWAWADQHIDDQVFDQPNSFLPDLEYETESRKPD